MADKTMFVTIIDNKIVEFIGSDMKGTIGEVISSDFKDDRATILSSALYEKYWSKTHND